MAIKVRQKMLRCIWKRRESTRKRNNINNRCDTTQEDVPLSLSPDSLLLLLHCRRLLLLLRWWLDNRRRRRSVLLLLLRRPLRQLDRKRRTRPQSRSVLEEDKRSDSEESPESGGETGGALHAEAVVHLGGEEGEDGGDAVADEGHGGEGGGGVDEVGVRDVGEGDEVSEVLQGADESQFENSEEGGRRWRTIPTSAEVDRRWREEGTTKGGESKKPVSERKTKGGKDNAQRMTTPIALPIQWH
jgi:hypothetical protein